MQHTKRSKDLRIQIDALIQKMEMGMSVGVHSEGTTQFTVKMNTEMWETLLGLLHNNTVDNPAIVKAKDDEPIFVLRGQDETAEQFVEGWAWQYYMDHANREVPGGLREAFSHMKKHGEARHCAEAMRKYQPKKKPD